MLSCLELGWQEMSRKLKNGSSSFFIYQEYCYAVKLQKIFILINEFGQKIIKVGIRIFLHVKIWKHM